MKRYQELQSIVESRLTEIGTNYGRYCHRSRVVNRRLKELIPSFKSHNYYDFIKPTKVM